jgi:site-specific DNA recombinase
MFTRFVSLQMRRRGVAMRLVIGGEFRAERPTLLKAVARGHRWFNELVFGSGGVHSRDRRARRGERTFRARLIPLAFLSPTLVQARTEDRQPAAFNWVRLVRSIDIPPSWTSSVWR